jgi:hypothetical protein
VKETERKQQQNAFIARPAGDGVCVVEAAELSHTQRKIKGNSYST